MSAKAAVWPGGPVPGAIRPRESVPDREARAAGGALTEIVGRERELGRVADLLARSRLLTLCGVGGIGKSLLARVAAAKMDAYQDGAGASPAGAPGSPARYPVYVVELDETA